MNARQMERWVSLGTFSWTVAWSQASALASAVGREASAAAACSWPEMVLSRSSSSATSSAPKRPARARWVTSAQRRSVSMARPSMARLPSSRPARSASACVGVGGGGVAAREGELVVAAGLGGHQQLAEPALPASSRACAVGRRGVRVHGLGGVHRDPRGAEGVGLGADVGEHQLDEVGRAHLGVAGHVPGSAPAQRPRERVVEPAQAADHRRERALVEADLGVGQVAVVEQQQVGLPLADELLDRGQLALDVDLDVAAADQVAVLASS